ncbi:MAG: DUF6261 family protein [Tannerellaceae bacterium]|jgi:hypothetical protein|nr:DUF6261 family protein [Tannerellaceae bacterium]
MKQIENFSVLMNHSRIDEFDELIRLLDQQFIAQLPLAQDHFLNTLHQVFHSHCLKEEEIMKPIMASPLTFTLEQVNRERNITTSAICHVVETNAKNEFESDRKAAAQQLLPIVHAYKDITHRTLTGTTSYERNFVYDLLLPENAAAVNILGIEPQIERAGILNQQFEDFLLEREHKWQGLHPGSLKPLRREIGIAFRILAECTNHHYLVAILEGAPSAALEKIIDDVNDIFRIFRRTLAHRGLHVAHESDDHQTPDDDAPDAKTQTPTDPNEPHH